MSPAIPIRATGSSIRLPISILTANLTETLDTA
jgi:hypothetical protein